MINNRPDSPGVQAEAPANVALIRSGASDATVRVEFLDVKGKTLLNSDNSAFKELTISSTAKSLAKFVVDSPLNTTTTIPGLPNGTVGGRLLVTAGSAGGIAVNTGGTDDGTGVNGLVTNKAPTASGPLLLAPGDLLEFGRVG